jgi:hypothetical protein
MWRSVDIVLTDVSGERIAPIFMVEEKRRKSFSTLKMNVSLPSSG